MTPTEYRNLAENFILAHSSPDYDELTDYYGDLEPDQAVIVLNYIYDAKVEVSW